MSLFRRWSRRSVSLSQTGPVSACTEWLRGNRELVIDREASRPRSRLLVFPAASSPSINILISLFPNIFDNIFPIFVVVYASRYWIEELEKKTNGDFLILFQREERGKRFLLKLVTTADSIAEWMFAHEADAFIQHKSPTRYVASRRRAKKHAFCPVCSLFLDSRRYNNINYFGSKSNVLFRFSERYARATWMECDIGELRFGFESYYGKGTHLLSAFNRSPARRAPARQLAIDCLLMRRDSSWLMCAFRVRRH